MSPGMVARTSAVAASAATVAAAPAYTAYGFATGGGGDYGEVYALVLLAAIFGVGARRPNGCSKRRSSGADAIAAG